MTRLPKRDWEAECIDLTRRLVRQDTANPPGNEYRAGQVLAEFLESSGIDVEVIDSGGGRASVVARLSGKPAGRGKPGLLLSHLDVSPVQEAFWSVAPFGAEVRDGYLWGRGAIDIKSLVAAHAIGLAALKQRDVSIAQDVVLLCVADETRGGAAGIRWLEVNRPDLLDVAWVLGEGSFSYPSLFDSSAQVFTYSPQEKTALWLTLSATGEGGHSSVPRGRTAVERLVAALGRVLSRAPTVSTGPIAQRFLAALEEDSGGGTRPQQELLEVVQKSPAFAAMFTDTVSTTIIRAGMETSVVPSEASAVLDCRLLPETNPDAFIYDMKSLIADLDISVAETFRAVSGRSDPDGPVASALARAVSAVLPDAIVAPVVSAGYTDLRIFRAKGIPAYGCHVAPITLSDRATISGHDERIAVDSLAVAARIVIEFLSQVLPPARGSDA